MKAVFINDGVTVIPGAPIMDQVFGGGRKERLAELVDLHPKVLSSKELFDNHSLLKEVDVVFSTWGFVPFSSADFELMPRLKAIFYAGGGSAFFRQAMLDRGITVCSSVSANAIPVAEFALSHVLLAGAGYLRNSRNCIDPASSQVDSSFRGVGNYGKRVSILGDGSVSRQLQRFLSMHDLEVVVVSSWENERTHSIEEAFETSFAVVNVFPDLEDNTEIYQASHFRSMMEGAVFINAGRGRQVCEKDLIEVMREREDLTAVLDVQWPEPPVEGSELYTLPNVQLSAHVAGSKSAELLRMADFMIEDFIRFTKGEPLLYEVQEHFL